MTTVILRAHTTQNYLGHADRLADRYADLNRAAMRTSR
jgi:hypothetical protein